MFKKFVIGVDRAKMRLYDVEQNAQTLSQDPDDDKPTFDKSRFGQKNNYETRSKVQSLIT